MFRRKSVQLLRKACIVPPVAESPLLLLRRQCLRSRRGAAAPKTQLSPRFFTISHSRQSFPPLPPPPTPKTTQNVTDTEPLPPIASPEPQPRPRRRSRRRGLIYSTIFLCVGISVGSLFRFSIAPPPLPTPGSPEDAYVISEIHTQASRLPLVQTLSSDRAWTSWDAYTEPLNSRGGAAPRVTLGAMSGSRGLPYQRVFHNASTGEIISVVYFGGGLAGWPGVVHGGALATVLDESLGRCAIKRFPARTGVTARLELTYKRPTTTNVFYVVKVRPVVQDGVDDVVGKDGSRKSDRKMWVEGHVETATGKVCIEAKALFVVPKGITLMPMSEGF